MNEYLQKYPNQVSLLVSFVEGRLEPEQLEAALVSDYMENLLVSYVNFQRPHGTNYYLKLLEQERNTLGGLVNTEGFIEEFLTLAEVVYKPARRYGKVYDLILSTLPNYIAPPIEFLIEKIVPTDDGLSDSKKKQIIKERLSNTFQFAGKPPKWLQSSEWPIENGAPLFFIGQLKISVPKFFHDEGMAYLFYNAENGEYETITQFY
jgi:hypothetical protein